MSWVGGWEEPYLEVVGAQGLLDVLGGLLGVVKGHFGEDVVADVGVGDVVEGMVEEPAEGAVGWVGGWVGWDVKEEETVETSCCCEGKGGWVGGWEGRTGQRCKERRGTRSIPCRGNGE